VKLPVSSTSSPFAGLSMVIVTVTSPSSVMKTFSKGLALPAGSINAGAEAVGNGLSLSPETSQRTRGAPFTEVTSIRMSGLESGGLIPSLTVSVILTVSLVLMGILSGFGVKISFSSTSRICETVPLIWLIGDNPPRAVPDESKSCAPKVGAVFNLKKPFAGSSRLIVSVSC
jgi:hypothetical protein